jgi:6-pyruvoyltetrahydropterin/6-carboxytetrahydropterin synthase
MLSITKIFNFEAAHRISNYNGPCKNIHGHTYKLLVTLSGEEPGDDDMLIDFKVLKKIVQDHIISLLDHALILKSTADHLEAYGGSDMKLFWMKTEPTAERMILWIGETLTNNLPKGIELKNLRLYETESSYVEWERKVVNTHEKYTSLEEEYRI